MAGWCGYLANWFGWLVGRLVAWLAKVGLRRFAQHLVGCSWLAGWSISCLVWLLGWLVWLVGRFAAWLVIVGLLRSVACLVGRSWSAGWLLGWLVWLLGWLVWLGGWAVCFVVGHNWFAQVCWLFVGLS